MTLKGLIARWLQFHCKQLTLGWKYRNQPVDGDSPPFGLGESPQQRDYMTTGNLVLKNKSGRDHRVRAGNFHLQNHAVPIRRFDAHCAAQQRHPFADAHQAEMFVRG